MWLDSVEPRQWEPCASSLVEKAHPEPGTSLARQDRGWDFTTVSRGTRACPLHWPQNETKWNLQSALQWEQTCKFLSHSVKDHPQVICFNGRGKKRDWWIRLWKAFDLGESSVELPIISVFF